MALPEAVCLHSIVIKRAPDYETHISTKGLLVPVTDIDFAPTAAGFAGATRLRLLVNPDIELSQRDLVTWGQCTYIVEGEVIVVPDPRGHDLVSHKEAALRLYEVLGG